MQKLFLIALLLAVAPGPAQARYMDSAALLKICQADGNAKKGNLKQNVCVGYIMGVFDAIEHLKRAGAIDKGSICVPNGVGAVEVVDTVVNFLRNNPKKGKQSSFTSIGPTS